MPTEFPCRNFWLLISFLCHSILLIHGLSFNNIHAVTVVPSVASGVGTEVVLISVVSAVSIVVVLSLCICCYARADDSDDENQSQTSDDQDDSAHLMRDDKKQRINPTSSITPTKTQSVTWMPSVDREVSVRTVQPDPTQQHSLNRTLGRASSQTVDFAKRLGSDEVDSASGKQSSSPECPTEVGDVTSPSSDIPYGFSNEWLGRLDFSVKYDVKDSTLVVTLLSAKNLPAKDFSGTSDPYVKMYLLPDRKHKLTSSAKKKNMNPVWNERFNFEGYPFNKITNKTLCLQVLDYDRFSRDDIIGEVLLPISDIDMNTLVTDGEKFSKVIQPSKGNAGKLGELKLSLCFHPSHSTITINILEARQLKSKDVNGLSDPYVKVWLHYEGRKIEKRKTKIIKKTLNPVYNATFVFKVPYDHIRQSSLLVSVHDHDLIGSNELIGRVNLGCKSGPVEAKHWNEMFQHPREIIEKWHVLKDYD